MKNSSRSNFYDRPKFDTTSTTTMVSNFFNNENKVLNFHASLGH